MAEHQCKLTIFPEGEAVCLECGALYIFSGHMVHEDLLDLIPGTRAALGTVMTPRVRRTTSTTPITMAEKRDASVYRDVLNDLLFDHLEGDVAKLTWLGEGRWLLADCEEPGLYVIEMYPAKAVRDD